MAWADLTVQDAAKVRDFYSAVVGWEAVPVPMGGYNDFQMNLPGTDQPAAGICHARGANANLPAQWLVYITVADLDASIEACGKHGGLLIAEPRGMGAYGRFCVIKDPAGAVMALIEAPKPGQRSAPKEKH
jgi:predicted enzyme related to lactoylglutathione lyase